MKRLFVCLAILALAPLWSYAADSKYASHAPMRSLPVAQKRALAAGPKKFVDAKRGDDAAKGTEQQPWTTIKHALRQLQPGDTLYLRGGVYYEKIAPTR